MAYFAQIDGSGVAQDVIVADEAPAEGTWVETFKGHETYAFGGRGMVYSEWAPMRFVHSWTQPTHAENSHELGSWCAHDGFVWENLIAANPHEPGTAGWRNRLGEYPQWFPPSGASDAYAIDDQVSHNGTTWVSTASANVWEPGVFGWVEA